MTCTPDSSQSIGNVWQYAARVAALLFTAATAALAQQPVQLQPVQRPPADSARPAALAFQGTTVIDVVTGRRLPNRTIVVVGDRIQAVGPVGRTPLPAGTRVLRANGTFAIPGLWDMHVHVRGFPNTFFPLFLANGVTGVRDMGSSPLDSMVQWRQEIAHGQRAGPRVVAAGPIIAPHWMAARSSSQVGADTPEEGRRLVDSLKQAGADFIKVYSELSRDVYFAIAAEARRVGLPFAGHLTDSVSVFEAADSGQHSIEHFGGVRKPCAESMPDPQRCRAIAARFRRNDTWLTMGVAECSGCQLPWFREQERYRPDSLYDFYDPKPGRPLHEPEALSVSLEQWAAMHTLPSILKRMREVGFRFIAGTDAAPLGFMQFWRPGFSLHDALWGHVQLGFTPLEALQGATLNPAKYFHAIDSMGTIAPGKVADVVFLDADPLADIFNTRRIRAVVADGRFYDRSDLDSLLIGVERLAKQSRRP